MEHPITYADQTGGIPLKRLLMIVAQAYPPSLGPGSLRTLGMSTHLPEFGWQPVVITFSEQDLGRLIDPSLARRVPPAAGQVFVRAYERAWYERWQRFVREVRGVAGRPAANVLDAPAAAGRPGGAKRKRSWLGDLSIILFGHEIWPASYGAVLCAARRSAASCHAIFSTSPPFQNHLVARRVHRASGLPWIAEFRDPYACGVWHLRARQFGRGRAERRERRVLTEASHVIVVTDAMRDLYLAQVPGVAPENLSVITNGYDDQQRRRADVLLNATVADPAGPLTILHAGLFYATDALEGLCRAIRLLVDGHEAELTDFVIEMIGVIPSPQLDVFRRHALDTCVRLTGRLSQQATFDRMCMADVLLVEAGENIAHYAIRAKVFEYMVARRPVLALLAEGPTARVVRDAGMGVCLHPSRTRDIADALLTWLRRKRAGDTLVRAGELPPQFDRRMLTGRLAALLDRLSPSAGMNSGES